MGGKYSREQFAARLGADGDPKLNAAADFAARLLNGPIGAVWRAAKPGRRAMWT